MQKRNCADLSQITTDSRNQLSSRRWRVVAGAATMGSSIFLSYASEQSEVAAQIELSLKGDRHSVFRDRTSLPPGDYLALFRWLFPEDDLKQGSGAPSLFEFLFVLAQLQEQASDQAGALSSYRRLLSEFKKENY